MASRFTALKCFLLAFSTCFTFVPSGWADVPYLYDDGSSELGVGIDPGEDSLWFNSFPVQPGGEIINSISVAYGRPGGTSALNGLPVSILLYEDLDGGAPWNAVLKTSISTAVANGNTNTLNVYPITPTEIHGTLLAAALYRNRSGVNKFIAALDRTAPHTSDASFYAYTVGDMNESDLSTVPAGQFGTIESIGFAGNWLLRANGTPLPEPMSATALFASMGLITRRRRARR